MAVDIHRKWAGLDVALIGHQLSDVLSTRSLELLHAWGNLVYADDTYAYKLTAVAEKSRCERSLQVIAALFSADPEFPTIRPVSSRARDIDLGSAGVWTLTIWPRLRVEPVSPAIGDVEPYGELGRILCRLHSLPVRGLDRHDPLVWAVARAKSVPDLALRESLSAEAEQLAKAYRTAFPAAEDVLVHGDIHWEQVARDEAGRFLLLDFEHAASGPACVDLVPSAGWLRRTGQPSEAQMAAFKSGYGAGFPALSVLQTASLADIEQFSRRTWDSGFPEQMGLRRGNRL